jgi:hypothetical protein
MLFFAIFLACLITGRPSPAEIIDCVRASEQNIYTIHIDEPSYAKAAFQDDNELKIFLDRLWFLLDQDRERRWVEGKDSPVRFVLCEGRKPSIDGREFDKYLVDLLYNQGIILEIWGVLDARTDNGEIGSRQAHISYLMVPVRFAYYSKLSGPKGIHILRYPESSDMPVGDFLEFFEHTIDIDAFVAVGLGIKSLRSKNYELAQENLCQAKLLLEQVQTRNISSRQKSQFNELIGYVKDAASKAIKDAKDDGAYLGSLRLLDHTKPCPEEASP